MKTIVLDALWMKTREEAHVYIKREFEFPDYYGENLDALWDMLTEESEETEVVIVHSQSLSESLGTYAQDLLDTFVQAAEENSLLRVQIC